MSTSTVRPRVGSTGKGERRRADLARAAATLMLREGPGALTHRRVAQEAGASVSATTYYFGSLDELAEAAGAALAQAWAAHARSARYDGQRVSQDPHAAATLVADAVLPAGDDGEVRSHYEHLLGGGRDAALARAFAAGRSSVDDAVERLVSLVGAPTSAPVTIAIVDGAVVSALTENRPIRPTAQALLVAAWRSPADGRS
ncbi:TetR/AcrR family transcriptional regulator [Cellulomonas sp. URHD0024]|uniref:TetR/AcrR family transcriptional regulator n=1 Tax=Cellulomonas sp. URHD0024 TaxID=1302620 RepID=UPI000407E4A1|nr:TetR family transcriptional regulator [Cellulomonas sp. URHD0024]